MLTRIIVILINTLAIPFLAAEYLLIDLVQDEAIQEPRQQTIKGWIRRQWFNQNI